MSSNTQTMSVETLILNVICKYIDYWKEKFPILISDQRSFERRYINGVNYITFEFNLDNDHKIFNADNGKFVGIFNSISNEIHYDENNENNEKCYTEYFNDTHSYRTIFTYEISKFTCEFMSKKFSLCSSYNIDNYHDPDYTILNEIIKEIFGNNQNLYNNVYLKLLYVHKYRHRYNGSDALLERLEFTDQDYIHFETYFDVYDLNQDDKNINIVIDFIAKMFTNEDWKDNIEQILDYSNSTPIFK